MIDQELKDLFKEIAEMQRETDRQFKETDAKIKENSEQQKKTDEQMRKTDEKLDRLAKLYGNVSKNQGDVAEEFFFNTINANLKIGNVKFDDITANQYKVRNGVKDEYDILLTNGDSVAIIEVKYKAHENDLDKLKTKKIPNFRKLFPMYNDYKIYAGIAGFHINEDVVKKAEEYGFFVLKRKGEIVESDTTFMKEQLIA